LCPAGNRTKVLANNTEGHERSTRKDYANFIAVTKGSLMETETYAVLAA
jgi:four helix bundle protein